ncbi:MAG TPA: hypothetical protein VK493_00110 [Bryobacteraceae bacterium]|nr:hypothetical protein [Bryobacteraceae bacterium]
MRHNFRGFECETAPGAGLAGKENGELLRLAEQAGFDVLLTVDRGIRYQQNLTGRKIAVLILGARSNKLGSLLPYIGAAQMALTTIKPGEVVRVGEL